MEQLNDVLHDKYTRLKKRKLLDDGTERKRELDIKEMCQALKEMEIELQNLQNENDRLRNNLIDNEQKLAETRTLLVVSEQQLAETRTLAKELESENLRLQHLLADKNDTNNYTAPVSPETIPEVVIHNQTPILPTKRTPESNRANKVQSSENATVHHSSFQDEARELDCRRRQICASGNGTDESSSAIVYHMLAEALVDMKLSLKNEMERFSLLVYHEASGYNFSLTWLEQPDGGEWAYKYSSLGTLERIAKEWMKEDIRFSMTMCPVFFQRISRLIREG